MKNHLESYLKILSESSPEAVISIRETIAKLVPEHVESFSHKEHIKGLLLGQVQSGKTGQMFGVIAATADTDDAFSVFVLLTSDITALQQQTYLRALETLDTFNICDENDDIRFLEKGKRTPSIIILKKNSNILKKWRNILGSSGFCNGRPIFIIDDEADAASLNTKVNQEPQEQSAINTHLSAIQQLSTSSFYLQVTATPQSLFLQTEESGSKPSFVHYFRPGKRYLGGEFFYSRPRPFTNKTTDDDELSILLDTDQTAGGMKRAVETFLITAAHTTISKDSNVCNFLIHPSVRINDHEKIKSKVGNYLQEVFQNLNQDIIKNRLKSAWDDLKESKPDIKDFTEILSFLDTKPSITVYTMNSGPESNSRLTFDEGLNIIIGGNSLGRGVTFKSLQTVYYCRSTKSPQADTFWQHSRMFGYDRDPNLMRIFMPEALFNIFYEINSANEVLLNQIEVNRFDEIQIITSKKLRPTRKNVIDQSRYDYIVGGTNYFPPVPDQSNAEVLDAVLDAYDEKKTMYDITIDEALKILKSLKSDPVSNWSIEAFSNALKAISSHKEISSLVN